MLLDLCGTSSRQGGKWATDLPHLSRDHIQVNTITCTDIHSVMIYIRHTYSLQLCIFVYREKVEEIERKFIFKCVTLAHDCFPIFIFLIFRQVGNLDVRHNYNVHSATLVRSRLSLTDKQTHVRLENPAKLNWTKHKFKRGPKFPG